MTDWNGELRRVEQDLVGEEYDGCDQYDHLTRWDHRHDYDTHPFLRSQPATGRTLAAIFGLGALASLALWAVGLVYLLRWVVSLF